MTKIYCKTPENKAAWRRTISAAEEIWQNLDKPDGKLKSGKGWNYEIPFDTVMRYLLTKSTILFQSDVNKNIIWIL